MKKLFVKEKEKHLVVKEVKLDVPKLNLDVFKVEIGHIAIYY